ncbi:MAG: alanine:cation symporter family protein [Nannocystaceae bacterium]
MRAAFDPTSSTLGITLVYLVLGAGVLVLLGSLGIQLRGLARALRRRGDGVPVLRGSMAASAGLASVVGAALAIELGGPGALPWMWIVTFLGMGVVWAEVVLAARTRGHDRRGILRASPMRAMALGLGGAGIAIASLYGIAVAIAALGVGALLHGQQLGALFGALTGAEPAAIAALLALLAAPLVLSVGTRFGPKLRALCLSSLPILLAIYVVVALAALLGDAAATAAALDGALRAAFSGDAALGGAAGGALAALTHAVLRTTMTGPGLGVAALAPEVARAKDPEDAATRAMLGPALAAGLVGTLTALTLLSQGPRPDATVAERQFVYLETHQSRALLPSERGQTIVLPEAGDTPLEKGKLYELVLRSDPRGHRVGKIFQDQNLIAVPAWEIAADVDAVILRDRDPERRTNAGYDMVIPCTREVIDTRAGPWLKLAPVDPTINLRTLMTSRDLDGPFLPLADFRFVGAVERAISGHPKFGEHLSLYEPDRDDRPFNPTLREILELGFRGPYTGVDEAPLPAALPGAPGFLPEIGAVVRLRLEPPARGLDIGFINRANELETPDWDFLAAAHTVLLRHPENPALDVEIPVVARRDRGRLRFTTATPGFDFAAMRTMTSHTGPYLMPAALDVDVEVHGDARLPAPFKGRRALLPLPPAQGRAPDLRALLRGEMSSPRLAIDGASGLVPAWRKGLGALGSWAGALAAFALGLVGVLAWASAGAAGLRRTFGAGAGLSFRLVFVGLCAVGGTLSLADVLRIADLGVVIAAELQLIGLIALLPRVFAKRT